MSLTPAWVCTSTSIHESAMHVCSLGESPVPTITPDSNPWKPLRMARIKQIRPKVFCVSIDIDCYWLDCMWSKRQKPFTIIAVLISSRSQNNSRWKEACARVGERERWTKVKVKADVFEKGNLEDVMVKKLEKCGRFSSVEFSKRKTNHTTSGFQKNIVKPLTLLPVCQNWQVSVIISSSSS